MPVNVNSSSLPPSLNALISVGSTNAPRFWATVWSDVLKRDIEASTRRMHLASLDRFYAAVARQRRKDCLDSLIADADADALEDCLMGFLAQLQNEAAINGVDRSSTWQSAVAFVVDMLRRAGNSAGARAAQIEAKLLRIETLYNQLAPNPEKPPAPIRALPALVVEDLYEVFRPDSPRNPFKTETLRWRNLLLFMLLLRLGLRRGEAALLIDNSFKHDFDPVSGKTLHWVDIEDTNDGDPRYELPSLKTPMSRRQLPVQKEVVDLVDYFRKNHRGRADFPHLLMSQKAKPLALRSINKVFDIASEALSDQAKASLKKQKLNGVSPHDCRHTSAVVRMTLYKEAGFDITQSVEKLRVYFGWSKKSDMPRHYAKAYFETSLAEVWNEKFDTYVDALRSINPEMPA